MRLTRATIFAAFAVASLLVPSQAAERSDDADDTSATYAGIPRRGLLQVACSTNTQCPHGHICMNGRCSCPTAFPRLCKVENLLVCRECCTATHCPPNMQCQLGRCVCKKGFGNCDCMNSSNGCEANLASNHNCGRCGNRCFKNEKCVRGQCVCNVGFADCDGMQITGCEASLATQSNCGGCNLRCKPSEMCGPRNTCVCRSADLTTSSNCGKCGNMCHESEACTRVVSAGGTVEHQCRCKPSASAAMGDCDGVRSNGCEMSLSTVNNCGFCGRTCPDAASMTCSNGVCACTATGKTRLCSDNTCHECCSNSDCGHLSVLGSLLGVCSPDNTCTTLVHTLLDTDLPGLFPKLPLLHK